MLAYLYVRVSKYGICYPTQQEIAYELGLEGTKNLAPYIKKLEAKNLISTHVAMGKKFFLVHDPRHGNASALTGIRAPPSTNSAVASALLATGIVEDEDFGLYETVITCKDAQKVFENTAREL